MATVPWRTFCLAGFLAASLAAGPLRAQSDLAALQKQADSGDSSALSALGAAYAAGQGVPQDYAKALQYFKQAADLEYAPALFNLGLIYETGRGAPQDMAAAFRNYLAAAKLGLAQAQFNVGNMYAEGRGFAADPFEAAIWFREAATQGLAEAQYNLGLAYEEGHGVTKNEEEAQTYFRAAANQGHVRASYNLALMLENGVGSPADLPAAAQLYRTAALQGFGPAQNNYGIMLAKGRGIALNLPEAQAWLSLAVENGVAPENRDIISRRLTPEQAAQADAALSTLRSQISHPGETKEIKFAAEASPLPAAAPEGSLRTMLIVAPPADSASVAKLTVQLSDARETIEKSAQNLAGLKEKLASSEADLARERTQRMSDLADFTSQLEELRAKQAESEKAAVKSAADLFAANQQLISTEQTLVGLQAENSKRPEREPPAPRTTVSLPRVHIVQDGDSLVRISVEYYGTESRWQDIYDANRDLLEGEHSLKVGQHLKIP